MKIAAAAGVSWVQPSGRVDGFGIQNLWVYRMTAVYLSYDGVPQVIQGEKEIDYRDGSAQIGGWTPADWKALPKGVYSINGWSDRRGLRSRIDPHKIQDRGNKTKDLVSGGVVLGD